MTELKRRPLPHDFHPPVPSFTVTSADVEEGATLGSAQVQAEGDTSPQLRWEGFPPETKSFAVTCYDPDAPPAAGSGTGPVRHPASVTELPAGAGGGKFEGCPRAPCTRGTTTGRRTSAVPRRRPGDGPHRYVFTVYAVDQEKLGPDSDASPAVVGFNLRFHAIARAQLVGEYENPAKG